jgi:hypothetical protein
VDNDGINEVPRDEWEQTKRAREQQRAATQTAGEDWDLARECWLRLEWKRKPVELRNDQPEHRWAEIGQKIGVSDAEMLRDWPITLEQARRELPAYLAGAFERVAKAATRAEGEWELTGTREKPYFSRIGEQPRPVDRRIGDALAELAQGKALTDFKASDATAIRGHLNGVTVKGKDVHKGRGTYTAPDAKGRIVDKRAP